MRTHCLASLQASLQDSRVPRAALKGLGHLMFCRTQTSSTAFLARRLPQLECASWALSGLSRQLYYLTGRIWSGEDILARVTVIRHHSEGSQCRSVIPSQDRKHHPLPLPQTLTLRHSLSMLNSEALAWIRHPHSSPRWPGQCLQCRAFLNWVWSSSGINRYPQRDLKKKTKQKTLQRLPGRQK